MTEIGGLIFLVFLTLLFIFGLVGYIRGKRVKSCCDVTPNPKLEKKAS